MSGHADLSPGELADLDQKRASAESKAREHVDAFRHHADQCHDGDTLCANAVAIMSLMQYHPLVIANICAGAFSIIDRQNAEIGELRAELGR